MRRITHTLLGAAVAMPIAVSHDPLTAAGCLWWGMVGGGLPDWFDLRSDLRRPLRLRHRGVSHSLLFLALASASVFLGLNLFGTAGFAPGGVDLSPSARVVGPWVASTALGIASHLASDACTRGGIRPFLPFSDARVWLLPRLLRSRFNGYLDLLFRLVAIGWIGVLLIAYIGARLS
jgi:membrane-bound metal-dependent hydrolase YbcI (DUF457 family)